MSAGETPKLANPKSSAARAALRSVCAECQAQPSQWCTGRNGKRLYRLHYARAAFKAAL